MVTHKTGPKDRVGEQQQARNMQSLYFQVIRQANNNPTTSPLDIHELSATAQVSIQSGSDCTINNELQADHSEFHDQLLVKCHENLSEPVYVISRNGYHNRQTGEQSQQLHILDPTELWPYSEPATNYNGGDGSSLSRSTQVSTATNSMADQQTIKANSVNNNVCQLVGDMQINNGHMPIPIGFLPNSLSIPVSLSDCIQFGQPHRHLSQQDFLNQTGQTRQCIANTILSGIGTGWQWWNRVLSISIQPLL